ncbi:hypothetical protein CBR_g41080 [Chara braunii]|uniref:Ribosomal RNA methyltransferase FtsJ domain-containing protein n=1 Tax=Chara braunii TaxID=69332 RepID=A0A388LV21_CHABU|nr:hypothetical protein CBR_g41080 [Chara braunii]|eukprot:GBG86176.1 hypothetical protein CBR_g41080 [Chara braunii]
MATGDGRRRSRRRSATGIVLGAGRSATGIVLGGEWQPTPADRRIFVTLFGGGGAGGGAGGAGGVGGAGGGMGKGAGKGGAGAGAGEGAGGEMRRGGGAAGGGAGVGGAAGETGRGLGAGEGARGETGRGGGGAGGGAVEGAEGGAGAETGRGRTSGSGAMEGSLSRCLAEEREGEEDEEEWDEREKEQEEAWEKERGSSRSGPMVREEEREEGEEEWGGKQEKQRKEDEQQGEREEQQQREREKEREEELEKEREEELEKEREEDREKERERSYGGIFVIYIVRIYWCRHVAAGCDEVARHVTAMFASLQKELLHPNRQSNHHDGQMLCEDGSAVSEAPQLTSSGNGVCVAQQRIPSLQEEEGNGNVASAAHQAGVMIDLPVSGSGHGLGATGLSSVEERLRLQAFPKSQEEYLKDQLPDVELGRAVFTHALHVVDVGGVVRWDLANAQDMYISPHDSASMAQGSASRAVCKLEEVFQVKGLRLHQGLTVLDLGAAPGAWTEFLSKRVGLVVAVDPAEMSSQAMRKNVIHIKTKAEDAVEEIAARLGDQPFDALVCDVNKHPVQIAQQMALKLLPFLKPKGLFVMTMKFHGRGRDKSTVVEEVEKLLAPSVQSLKCMWLLANTSFERTLVGVKSYADK